jgi:hypothetical protein
VYDNRLDTNKNQVLPNTDKSVSPGILIAISKQSTINKFIPNEVQQTRLDHLYLYTSEMMSLIMYVTGNRNTAQGITIVKSHLLSVNNGNVLTAVIFEINNVTTCMTDKISNIGDIVSFLIFDNFCFIFILLSIFIVGWNFIQRGYL